MRAETVERCVFVHQRRGIFFEDDISDPVQAVLNLPMCADDGSGGFRVKHSVGKIVASVVEVVAIAITIAPNENQTFCMRPSVSDLSGGEYTPLYSVLPSDHDCGHTQRCC